MQNRQVPPAMWVAALWTCVVTATFLSLVFVWFLLDPKPGDGGAKIALVFGATSFWCIALMLVPIRRAYRKRQGI